MGGTVSGAAHFDILEPPPELEPAVREFLVPALEAVPHEVWARLGRCRIRLAPVEADWSSRWTAGEGWIEIELAAGGAEAHDLALEALLCLGQSLWDELEAAEYEAWLELLGREIQAGVTGEIDETALEEKRRLVASRVTARSRRRLERYAQASFAATFAEYVHALWHDVTVRTGPEHLPPEWLRRRLELLLGWFAPRPGYRLFP
jgi:hypothetical protein